MWDGFTYTGREPKITLHTTIQMKKRHLDATFDVILTLKPLRHSSNNRPATRMPL